MHALTRSTSGMYCWQSRIASGSQAARCSGDHCCAAAGPDANVSARPRSAVGSAAAAMIGPSFACAIRISIIDPPAGVLPRYLQSIQWAWQAAMLATVILQRIVKAILDGGVSSVDRVTGANCRCCLPFLPPGAQRAPPLPASGERFGDCGRCAAGNSIPVADGQLLGWEQRDHAATLVGHHDLLLDAGGGVAVARRAIGLEREYHALLDFGRMVERDHA